METNKRYLCIIIAIAMIICMMPTMVFATDSTVWDFLYSAIQAEDIGDGIDYSVTDVIEYTTQNSITYTIKLLTDVAFVLGTDNVTLSVPEGRDVTINLNGYKIDRGLSGEAATTDGYVIKVESGASLTITGGGIITGGKNNGKAGGILVDGGNLTMNNCTISNCKALYGGGVYVSGGSVALSDCTIQDCEAFYSDAIEDDANLSGNGGGIYNGGHLVIQGGLIENCKSHCGGGGIYNKYDDPTSLIMTGGEIRNCVANGVLESAGGGIYNDRNEIYIANAKVVSCAAAYGGGIFNNGTMTLDNTRLEECKASLSGGGAYNSGCYYSINPLWFGNLIVTNGSIIASCEAINYGGGICNDGHVELYKSEVKYCQTTPSGIGGGIYNFTKYTYAQLNINSGKVYGCSSMFGGGLTNMGTGYVATDAWTNIYGDSLFKDNKAYDEGGAIFNSGTMIMYGNTNISRNVSNGYGGGVYNNNSQLFFVGGKTTIKENKQLLLEGTSERNSNLYANATITLGSDVFAPEDEMCIGITTGTEPADDNAVVFSINGTETDTKYFFNDKDNQYVTFDSVLKLAAIPDGYYQVDLATCQNGEIAANTVKLGYKEYAQANTPVAVIVTPAAGYVLKSLSYTPQNGEAINVAANGGAYSFLMTDKAITIAAIFELYVQPYHGGGVSYYEITTNAGINGTFSVDKKSASSGETVTITVEPERGFALETLTVLNRSGKEIEVKELEKNKYTFKMPASKVTVNATFMEDNTILNYCVDVKKEDYFYEPVLWSYENEICKGTDELHFSPNKTLTRAEAVTFLWRVAGKPVVNYWMQFKDVESSRYYTEAVRWAASEKIANGYSDTQFGVTDLVTREQLATMIYRYVQKKGEGFTGSWMFLLPYNDRAKISDWANEAAHWCSMKGIINGKSGNIFDPQGTATRAEAITMLYRFDNLMK